MPVSVRLAGAGDEQAWDAYVRGADEATFFHLWGWRRAVEAAFAHDCPYLLAESGGVVAGVLPLVRIRSRLFGHSLTSTAFAVYGGALGDTPDVSRALVERAVALADEMRVDYLELRHLRKSELGWPSKDDAYATFRRPISGDADANLKAIPRKQRAVVRKALERCLASEIDDGLDRFFRLYATSVRNLGTPVFPRRWFAALKDVFGEACDVLVVSHDGTPVSAVMNFYFRGEVLPYYGGGGREARALGANDFMYYDLMCRAGARGCAGFDFGRSKVGSGAYAFKRNFGFDPTPLHHEFYLRGGGGMPETSPTNPKYRLMIQAWSRLPLPVANALGPLISRSLG
ncbi:MAG: FemAB family PEP-CTERM system-associated protein [Alphaproteobacteria bacterium]|nr:FemAB family PEP-CTERM system-associated protein [Alphaproteobacteria bacterium]